MNTELLKMNLQLLAEEETGENNNNGVNAGNNEDNVGNNKTGKEKEDNEKLEKKYTEKDLDDIIEKKIAKMQKQKQKEIDEAKKLAEMNAQEKAEYERDKIYKELEELKTKNAKSEMLKTARHMLSEQDINISDNILEILVTQEAESTKANVENFVKLFNAEVEKAVNEKVKGTTPKKGATKNVTKEDILKIENKQERQKAILKNLDLFE